MYDYILLDLDGTIANTGQGITSAVMYALKKFGIEEHDRNKLYKFIGPPLVESFAEFYGFTPEQSDQATAFYREYYGEKGIYETTIYDGVREMIIELKKRGKKVILATSKPSKFSVRILEQNDLIKFFDYLACATIDGSRKQKVDIINYALENNHITDKSSVLMVGDRKHDIIGAKKAGVKVAAVLYGFGNRAEFEEYGADYIIEKPQEILELAE